MSATLGCAHQIEVGGAAQLFAESLLDEEAQYRGRLRPLPSTSPSLSQPISYAPISTIGGLRFVRCIVIGAPSRREVRSSGVSTREAVGVRSVGSDEADNEPLSPTYPPGRGRMIRGRAAASASKVVGCYDWLCKPRP